MNRGDIWLAEFANAKGHEQTGTRPVILLSGEVVNVCIVVPLTSNQLASRFPCTLELEPNRLNCLSAKSVALVFQMRAIDKRRLIRRIGTLEIDAISKIEKLIKDLIKI